MWDLLVVVLGYLGSMWDLCCGMQDLLVAAREIFLVVECGIFLTGACRIFVAAEGSFTCGM